MAERDRVRFILLLQKYDKRQLPYGPQGKDATSLPLRAALVRAWDLR